MGLSPGLHHALLKLRLTLLQNPATFRLPLVFLIGDVLWKRSFRHFRRTILGGWFLLCLASMLLIQSGFSRSRNMLMGLLNATRLG
jgi:hypothetical protein